MGFSTVCDAQASGKIKGTGRSGKTQAGAAQELFWSPEGFSFANKADAVSKAAWDAAVLAGNLVYIGTIEEFDSNDTEATFYESPNGNYRTKTAEAQRVRQYRLIECSCTHAALLSLDGQNGRLLIRTSRGYLKARIESDGTVRGLKTSQFDVGLLTAATAETPAFTPIDVTYETPVDDDKDVFEDVLDFQFSQVDQVFDAPMKAAAVSSNGSALDFTLSIFKGCSDVKLLNVADSDMKVEDINGNALPFTFSASGDDYSVSVTTALTSVIISIDGNKLVGGVIYSSDDLTVSV